MVRVSSAVRPACLYSARRHRRGPLKRGAQDRRHFRMGRGGFILTQCSGRHAAKEFNKGATFTVPGQCQCHRRRSLAIRSIADYQVGVRKDRVGDSIQGIKGYGAARELKRTLDRSAETDTRYGRLHLRPSGWKEPPVPLLAPISSCR